MTERNSGASMRDVLITPRTHRVRMPNEVGELVIESLSESIHPYRWVTVPNEVKGLVPHTLKSIKSVSESNSVLLLEMPIQAERGAEFSLYSKDISDTLDFLEALVGAVEYYGLHLSKGLDPDQASLKTIQHLEEISSITNAE